MANTSRILVVDDEAGIRQQLRIGLTQRGFEVECAGEGVPAVERIQSARQGGTPHDYVVMDLRLPDIDGRRLMEVVNTTYPEVGLIAISGFGSEYDTDVIDRMDGCVFLDKPFGSPRCRRPGPGSPCPSLRRPRRSSRRRRRGAATRAAGLHQRGPPARRLDDREGGRGPPGDGPQGSRSPGLIHLWLFFGTRAGGASLRKPPIDEAGASRAGAGGLQCSPWRPRRCDHARTVYPYGQPRSCDAQVGAVASMACDPSFRPSRRRAASRC
jgi:CheY-like chemotaxis protein